MGNSCRSLQDEEDRGRVSTSRRPTSASGSAITNSKHNLNLSIYTGPMSDIDEKIVSKLNRDMEETPEVFVLNQILMSVMFFDNFKKDVSQFSHANSPKMEKELNEHLIASEGHHCILPDVIFEIVNKNICFRPQHGEKKLVSETIAPRRIFVVNENIEVLNTFDVPQYSEIDKPTHKVNMEELLVTRNGFQEQTLIHGFVNLRQLEKEQKIDCNCINSFKDPQPGPSRINQGEDDTYEYRTITEVRTPKPISIVENTERRNTLPKTCFVQKKEKNIADPQYDSDFEEDTKEKEESDETDKDDKLYTTITYISSQGFMDYFQNSLFPNSLGKALGFEGVEIELAKSIPGIIFCNLFDEADNKIPCEVIPCVRIDWPSECTLLFEKRPERPTVADIKTGYRYRWPTDEMIAELRSLTCVLIPRGNILKRGNKDKNPTEWEIAFPKAERYIEARMSHQQIKSLLYLICLFKTHIEPDTKTLGLLIDHIRIHMYWECESNYRDWPEHRLGTKLLRVINNLMSRLSKGVLPDYFIQQKNVFQNIQKAHLHRAQKKFHDILEAPIMHFLRAIRNIAYLQSNKFYPALDVEKLYSILVKESHTLVNNDLGNVNLIPPNFKKKKYKTPEEAWKATKEDINKQKILERRRRQQLKEEEEKNQNLSKERKGSVDSIDVEWVCEKKFSIFKKKLILIFFIEHYLEIAKKCTKLSTPEQASFYRKQAWYLIKLLELNNLQQDANDMQQKMSNIEMLYRNNSLGSEDVDLPPNTPPRNSIQFQFENKTQHLKSNKINLNNLNNSYNLPSPQATNNPTSFKQKPNLKTKSSIHSEEKSWNLKSSFKDDRRKSVETTGRKSVMFNSAVERCEEYSSHL